MAIVNNIVIAPDKRLNTECDKVQDIDEDIVRLAKSMAKTMYATDGCGIAAPQVGVLKQVVVIDVDWDGSKGSRKNTLYLINPEIVDKSEETEVSYEGCLSIPGVSLPIERSSSVVVRARDLQGRRMQYEASENLLAVCLQHEIDHLHGVTMLERLSPTQRLEAIKEYQAALAAGARPGETSAE